MKRAGSVLWVLFLAVCLVMSATTLVLRVRDHYYYKPYVRICHDRGGSLVKTISGPPTCFVGSKAGTL